MKSATQSRLGRLALKSRLTRSGSAGHPSLSVLRLPLPRHTLQTGAAHQPFNRAMRHLDALAKYLLPHLARLGKANIIMETTYFGRGFGVMVLMDSISQQVLFVREANTKLRPLY